MGELLKIAGIGKAQPGYMEDVLAAPPEGSEGNQAEQVLWGQYDDLVAREGELERKTPSIAIIGGPDVPLPSPAGTNRRNTQKRV